MSIHKHLSLVIIVLATTSGFLVAHNAFITMLVVTGVLLLMLITNKPVLGLYLFIFLIPLQDILIAPGSVSLLRLFGWALFVVWMGRHFVERKMPKISRGLLYAAIFMALGIISSSWALDRDLVLGRIPTMLQLLTLYWMVTDMIKSTEVLQKALWFYVVACIIGALVSSFLFISDTDIYKRASFGEYGSPNHLALTILPAIWFLFIRTINERFNLKTLLWMLLLSPLFFTIVLTASRAALFALAGSALMGLLLSKSKVRAFIVLVSFGLIVASIYDRVSELQLAQRFTIDFLLSDRGAGRFDIWLVGLRAASSHLVLGVGLGNFPSAFTRYYPFVSTIRVLPLDLGSHNIYLGTLVELGLPGLFLLTIWLAHHIQGTLVMARRRSSLDWPTGELAWVLFLSLFALLIGAFGLDILYRKYLWLSLAFSESLLIYSKGLLTFSIHKDSLVYRKFFPNRQGSDSLLVGKR